jgi:hypothetical protein
MRLRARKLACPCDSAPTPVDRASALLTLVVESGAPRTFTSLVAELGLAKSTTSRLLVELAGDAPVPYRSSSPRRRVSSWGRSGRSCSSNAASARSAARRPAGDISKNTVLTKQTAGTFSYDNQFTELSRAPTTSWC